MCSSGMQGMEMGAREGEMLGRRGEAGRRQARRKARERGSDAGGKEGVMC